MVRVLPVRQQSEAGYQAENEYKFTRQERSAQLLAQRKLAYESSLSLSARIVRALSRMFS